MTIRRPPADVVQFTRESAERISRVVRESETAPLPGSPLTFDRPGEASAYRLSVATFTGSWPTGQYKTVTLVNSTNTASVYNWCNAAEGDGHVLFGKASGTNSAVEITMASTATCRMTLGGVDLTQLTGYDENSIQWLGHNTTGPCLQWYNIVHVDVMQDVSLTTDAIEFERRRIGVFDDKTASTVSLSITTCSTAATG